MSVPEPVPLPSLEGEVPSFEVLAGTRLCRLLRDVAFPADRPLVLFLRVNAGKTLGHYVTGWGAAPRNLIVIDELSVLKEAKA